MDQILAMLSEAGAAASSADGPEAAMRALARGCHDTLGDRAAAQRPGALKESERDYRVSGCFMVTPDRRWHMLVGNVGFPPEQHRLMIPIEGGHPGRVLRSGAPLLLTNTDEDAGFRQYLKTSRMGSSAYAPMLWKGAFLGQIVVAAQARWTYGERDLAALVVASRIAAAVWVAQGGPDWLAANADPADAWRVAIEGV
ncbi:GAF domain-containing protein [Falsiroseomonas oryziterrae]|uniref:GAF domain-containing protein n=1 Tax=Falsiroseomonas oryziterrae TaxID=2911368 RepID=UPI001F15C749|nr:GAF domain-containing protein [Roseomonas sp. NPKOSM-4]